jgi:hypothetical protein
VPKIVYCQLCGKDVVCYFKYALYHGAAVCILLCNMCGESRNVSYRISVEIRVIVAEEKDCKTSSSQER